MNESEPLVRNISDTALWAAVFRARESDRPDALFRDPFAKRLAGERGFLITDKMPQGSSNTWAWVTRTVLFDRIISEQIAQGVDMVINLAAGLDARPFRMPLPANLQWIEVDLPDLLAYKRKILADKKPVCALESVPLDLADVAARRDLLERLGARTKKALVITEGLLIYLTAEEVRTLAGDLARPTGVRRWVCELASPGLLKVLQDQWNKQLGQGGAPLRFGPPEGPGFFEPQGWRPIEVNSMLKTAARLGRLSLWMRLLALLPESKGAQGSRPWGGVCLLGRETNGG
jgi:methyltransferase (TIGR00027 family)